ncbi:MAG TPA: glycerate kinase [Tepidiformaceae bacterium]
MRVLIAPQEFRGSLSADEAAAAIKAGIRAAQPAWQLDVLPLSDGGPGFIDALRRAVTADTSAEVVQDALGRKVLGRFAVVRADRTAVVEAAQANGLYHLSPGELDPLRADSFGVGQLIMAAVATAPSRLVVGLGGSATTDGGAGMARALGARFLDDAGRPLAPGGAALAGLARIDWQRPAALEGLEVIVANDVTNPLLGPDGCAAIYGPQKGASPGQVEVLEGALVRYAAVVKRSLGVDVATIPGGGAAGGLGAGLVAFLGARVESGFTIVAEATNLRARLAQADVVVTGEGSFDAQSSRGKTTGRIRDLAREAGTPVVVFCGRSDVAGSGVFALTSLEPDHDVSMRNAAELLEALAARWAADQPA